MKKLKTLITNLPKIAQQEINYKQNLKSDSNRELGSVVVLKDSNLRVTGSNPT